MNKTGGKTVLLKEILFILKESTINDSELYGEFERTASYIEENNFIVKIQSEESDKWIATYEKGNLEDDLEQCSCVSNEDGNIAISKENILVVCDNPEKAKELSKRGFYCIGVQHKQNTNDEFTEVKYVFTELEEVDIDSFVKVYQRYANEPWEVIKTDRLIIRETTVDDVDEFYKLYKEPEMTQYMEGLFENPEDEKRYQKDYIEKVYGLLGFGVWTLVKASDNTVIGRAGYSIRNGFDEIELGFLIGKKYQRQGYAFEACKAILEYGRDVLNFDKVQTLVKKENQISINLCKKLGFKEIEEVTVEENIYGNGYSGPDTVNFSEAKYGKYLKMDIQLN